MLYVCRDMFAILKAFHQDIRCYQRVQRGGEGHSMRVPEVLVEAEQVAAFS